MKIKDLKAKLREYPPNADVFVLYPDTDAQKRGFDGDNISGQIVRFDFEVDPDGEKSLCIKVI